MNAHGFGLYGMYGPVTDPGERSFTARVKALGVDVYDSPYRDYQVSLIADTIKRIPKKDIIFVWGSSLGANNAPIVANYVNDTYINAIFGYQASRKGSRAPVPSNVLYAHEFWNPLWVMTWGLGAYKWELAPGNHVTKLVTTPRYAFHPGETAEAQGSFLEEMQIIMEGGTP